MNYFALGIGVGILVGILLLVIRTGAKRQKCEYDERQLAARQHATQTAFYVTLAALLLASLPELFGIRWCEAPLDKFLCAFLGLGVFVVIAIREDAYFGLQDRRRNMVILFAIVALCQLAGSINAILNGEVLVDGILTTRTLQPATALLFIVVVIALLVKEKQNTREDEE